MQNTMRRLTGILVVFAAVLFGVAAQAAPRFSAADEAALARISAYLNSIHSLRGDFVQIDPNGDLEQGRFYLEKPGRLRFEYNPPSPTLIVSDGQTVSVANKKLKTVDRYPLSSTPLDLILSDKIDLAHDREIVGVERQPGMIVVEARTSRHLRKPNVFLTFTDPDLELRQWKVIDDQGLPTTVVLSNLEQGVNLNDTLFVMRDMRRPVGVKRRD